MIFAHAYILISSSQGHIGTAKKGSVTSVQAVYVNLKDPALARSPTSPTWMPPASLRPIAELGIHPVVDSLDSKSRRRVDLRIVRTSWSTECKQVGTECYKVATAIQKILQHYKGVRKLERETFPSQSITPGPSPRVPLAACTEPGACQHDCSELAVLETQHYACNRERGAEQLYAAEVLGARPFQ